MEQKKNLFEQVKLDLKANLEKKLEYDQERTGGDKTFDDMYAADLQLLNNLEETTVLYIMSLANYSVREAGDIKHSRIETFFDKYGVEIPVCFDDLYRVFDEFGCPGKIIPKDDMLKLFESLGLSMDPSYPECIMINKNIETIRKTLFDFKAALFYKHDFLLPVSKYFENGMSVEEILERLRNMYLSLRYFEFVSGAICADSVRIAIGTGRLEENVNKRVQYIYVKTNEELNNIKSEKNIR